MTSGVPKKPRTCGRAGGTLPTYPSVAEPIRGLNSVDPSGGAKVPGPASEAGRGRPAETFALSVPPMSEVTRILSAIEQGDPSAADQLLPLVYDQLRQLATRKMAQEVPGQTLQATALVHEAYLRLVD